MSDNEIAAFIQKMQKKFLDEVAIMAKEMLEAGYADDVVVPAVIAALAEAMGGLIFLVSRLSTDRENCIAKMEAGANLIGQVIKNNTHQFMNDENFCAKIDGMVEAWKSSKVNKGSIH